MFGKQSAELACGGAFEERAHREFDAQAGPDPGDHRGSVTTSRRGF
ncbi:TAT-variant-translocated molybdopterin oxidoreductase [Streptomyces malaysiensis subsp. malaysiensis]